MKTKNKILTGLACAGIALFSLTGCDYAGGEDGDTNYYTVVVQKPDSEQIFRTTSPTVDLYTSYATSLTQTNYSIEGFYYDIDYTQKVENNTYSFTDGEKTKTFYIRYKNANGDYYEIHQYGVYEVIKTPTDKTTGVISHTCELCNGVEKKSLPKLTDPAYEKEDLDNTVTCQQGKTTRYTYKIDKEEVFFDVAGEPGEHTYELVSNVEPTLTSEGEIVKKCIYCNAEERTTYPVLNNIDYSVTDFNMKTCTSDGIKAYSLRTDLNTKFYVYDLATGHKFEDTGVNIPATCKQAGKIVKRCACGLTQTTVIPKLEHKWQTSALATTCSVCGEVKTIESSIVAENVNFSNTFKTTSFTVANGQLSSSGNENWYKNIGWGTMFASGTNPEFQFSSTASVKSNGTFTFKDNNTGLTYILTYIISPGSVGSKVSHTEKGGLKNAYTLDTIGYISQVEISSGGVQIFKKMYSEGQIDLFVKSSNLVQTSNGVTGEITMEAALATDEASFSLNAKLSLSANQIASNTSFNGKAIKDNKEFVLKGTDKTSKFFTLGTNTIQDIDFEDVQRKGLNLLVSFTSDKVTNPSKLNATFTFSA